ncbi:hypothetical protein [Microbacterium kunmingense]|uniref:hypothetical protein n=1 Tax=Microbacterium kunmingense TaxID=2915939 RepID=UPI0020030068|nr:hypothetical protein [Microbacterium kunmingense]
MSEVLQARSRKAVAVRLGDARAVEEASRNLAAAKIEQYIQKVVAEAPPLSAEQRDRLAGLLRTAEPAAKVLRRPTTVNERIISGGDVE